MAKRQLQIAEKANGSEEVQLDAIESKAAPRLVGQRLVPRDQAVPLTGLRLALRKAARGHTPFRPRASLRAEPTGLPVAQPASFTQHRIG